MIHCDNFTSEIVIYTSYAQTVLLYLLYYNGSYNEPDINAIHPLAAYLLCQLAMQGPGFNLLLCVLSAPMPLLCS